MNALWPAAAHQAVGGQVETLAADEAPASAHANLSPLAAPIAESLKLSAPKDDEQALRLLQVNRKLEAQLQVPPALSAECSCLALQACSHFVCSLWPTFCQELKGRVAALEAEKQRALTEVDSGKDNSRCAQQ
jgi:hypothetical protein